METTKDARLERLMDAHGTRLLNLCAVMLGDIFLAQEASQDVFVKAYRRLDEFRGQDERSERAWLTRIAINTCRDYRRTAWFRIGKKWASLDQLPEIEQAVEPEELGVLAQVQDLPVKCREVVLLRYVEQMTGEEIAKALGIRRSTVYRRLEKALELLKISMKERDGDA